MSQDLRILLHIGYHKTGTTWLQRVLFDDKTGGFEHPIRRNELINAIVLPAPLSYDPRATRARFLPAIQDSLSRGKLPVLSVERFSGNPHSGGYDSATLASRLHDTFPEATVLVMVREQVAMTLSCYGQYVRVGGPQSLRDYLSTPAMGQARVPRFRWEYLEYDLLVQRYRELFGPDRVRVFAFEQLRDDPAALAADIARVVGAKLPDNIRTAGRNTGMCAPVLTLKRHINRFAVLDTSNPGALIDSPVVNRALFHGFNSLDRLVPRPIAKRANDRLKRYIAAQVGARFQESNARLARLTGLPLRDFGYDMPPEARDTSNNGLASEPANATT